MKPGQFILTVFLLGHTLACDALAVTSARIYSSSIFVMLFLSFCALVVVIQLIPAIMTLLGMLKAAGRNQRESTGTVESERDSIRTGGVS